MRKARPQCGIGVCLQASQVKQLFSTYTLQPEIFVKFLDLRQSNFGMSGDVYNMNHPKLFAYCVE